MWYNYVRFENVLEFGAKYQLTIANMKDLGSRIFAIPTGIVCNFFSMPIFTSKFPFLLNHNNLITFNGYYYIENMIGGLFAISPICLFTFLIFRINKKIKDKELKILIISLIISGLIIAILSIMMAGSNQRYLMDYAWMFCLAGILIFEVLYNLLNSDEAKSIMQKILIVISIYTVIMGILSGIISEKSYIENNSKEAYYKLRYMICFWE